jgi:hypothetical protein
MSTTAPANSQVLMADLPAAGAKDAPSDSWSEA